MDKGTLSLNEGTVPKVSVIMSVYNEKKYLLDAIRSILNQKFTDFEFIIIDDGSEFPVHRLITTFTDRRIKLITNEKNIGLTASLNKGLLVASGDYIARQDADDVSNETRLYHQVSYLDRHPEIGLIGTSCTIINEIGNKINDWDAVTNPMELLKTGNRLTHGSVMFRRSIVKDIGNYDERFKSAQDYEYWLRISKKYQIRNLPIKLYQTRTHNGMISATNIKEQARFVIFAQRISGGNNEFPHEFCMTRNEKVRYHSMLAYSYVQDGKMGSATDEFGTIFKLDPLNVENLIRIIAYIFKGRDGIIYIQNIYRKIRR